MPVCGALDPAAGAAVVGETPGGIPTVELLAGRPGLGLMFDIGVVLDTGAFVTIAPIVDDTVIFEDDSFDLFVSTTPVAMPAASSTRNSKDPMMRQHSVLDESAAASTGAPAMTSETAATCCGTRTVSGMRTVSGTTTLGATTGL